MDVTFEYDLHSQDDPEESNVALYTIYILHLFIEVWIKHSTYIYISLQKIILRSIPGRVIPKTCKMVLDTTLLNTQQYKVCMKGKVEHPRKRNSALPYISV